MESIDVALLPISREDIRTAYLLNRAHADNSKTNLEFQIAEKTSDGTRLMYFLNFFTQDGTPILDKALECWLCGSKKLISEDRRSRVAVRVKIYLGQGFRGKGIGTYIVAHEELLFKKWGAAEIQLCAMDFGRWVWTRDKFGYSILPLEFAALQQRYRDWQRSRGAPSAGILSADRLSDFPQEFLLSPLPASLTLFKRL